MTAATHPGPDATITTFAACGDDIEAICFAAGTRILTATGERLVETLLPGDSVMIQVGQERLARPVKWLGRRQIDIAAYPWPHTVAPIRIHKGAVADNVPHRDLLVAPDHAILVDGMLVAARLLTNGVSIVQDTQATSVEYVVVELDHHAVLLAEGLPAETYFETGEMRGLPPKAVQSAHDAMPWLRLTMDTARVRSVWQRLADRGASLKRRRASVATTDDPGLGIRFKGKVFPPMFSENGLYIFALPRGATEVKLMSRLAAPAEGRPPAKDGRPFGTCVRQIVVRGSTDVIDIPLASLDAAKGWRKADHADFVGCRWTDGAATLRLPKIRGSMALLEVQLAEAVIYVIDDPVADKAQPEAA